MTHGNLDFELNDDLDVLDVSIETFARYVQIFCDSTASVLKSPAFVVYLVDALLMNFG